MNIGVFLLAQMIMKNQPIITFTTDFGDDFSLAQLVAIVLSINPQALPVTLSNNIAKFSILEGAFVLLSSSRFFPRGTIHVGVVDPGVGSQREIIAIKTSDFWFVGPNNGLFYPAVRGDIQYFYEVDMQSVDPDHSNTFHGRDIFSRLAALISRGEDILGYAKPMDSSRLVSFAIKQNQVVHIDSFGNIKINNDCRDYELGDKLSLQVNGLSKTVPFVKTFAEVQPGEILAYRGSHNILEIAKNLGSARDDIGASIGDRVTISVQR